MQSPFQRILTGVVFFSVTLQGAVAGYMLAGWTPLDAIYMVVITIFGVGYGEVNPLDTTSLRVFTILVIIAGALSVSYIVAGFVQLVTEGEIHRALHMRQMTREIQNLANHVIICGYGRMGQMLARKLREDQQRCIILDHNPERITVAQEEGYLVYLGDATDEPNLKAVGINRARALAIVLPDDAANVFISLTGRELNAQLMILARGTLPSSERKLRLAGADQVVLPANIGALRMAYLISHPKAMDFLVKEDGRANLSEMLAEIDIQVNELEIAPKSPLIGRTIGELEARSKGTFIIVALHRADGTVLIHPTHREELRQGDAVIIMGHQEDMPKFSQRLALTSQLRYRGARIR